MTTEKSQEVRTPSHALSDRGHLHLTFAGICMGRPCESNVALLFWLRQLCAETLVAAVETLRVLLLL